MAKISKAELKKVIVAAEAKRSKYPVVFRPDPAQYPKLRSGRRAAEKLVSGFLRKAGLETKELEALQKQQSTELRRIIDKHKADALKLASRQKDTLHSTILQQSKALRHLAAEGDGFFPSTTFLLDTPSIWTIPVNLALSDSAVVPGGSFAKFRLRSSSGSGTQKVSFYFFWTNPYSDYAVIDAITFLSTTGFVTANAPWTPLGSTSDVRVEGRFAIWFELPGTGASTPYSSAFLGGLHALSGSWLDPFPPGDTESLSLSGGVNITQSRFAIPPQQFVIFEVALALWWENQGGNIDADFESGDFKVVCPIVAFWLVNQPPMATAVRSHA